MNNKHKLLLEIVEKELSCSAHNLDHIMRVYKLSLKLAQSEKNVDLDILSSAALLHDIARTKESEDLTGTIDHAVLGSQMAEPILKNLQYRENDIEKIKHCIVTHRYRTGNEPQTIEAKILFDADKLDAIGSVGLMRSFMLAGQHGQKIEYIENIDDYIKINTGTHGKLKDMSKHSPLIEYHIKLKNIPKKLYTESAKKIGDERIKIMDSFFENLMLEMKGEA